jgi:hypothetical protein
MGWSCLSTAASRPSEFAPEADFVLQFFSTVETQGADGRFQVRDRDGAMSEMGRVVDPPLDIRSGDTPERDGGVF